jgi:GntR family transcriptional regulator
MPATSNRSRYQQRRQVPIRANDSVRRTYDLLRSTLATMEPNTLLVENDLVDHLSASRQTVRMVLQLLASEGLVTRGPKVGTTVRDSLVLSLDEVKPISDWGKEGTVHGHVLESIVIPAPAIVGQRLGLAEHAPLAVLETLILEDVTPIALSTSYAGWRRGSTGDAREQEPDIISFLEQQLEVCVSGSATTVSALAADSQTATLLDLHEGEPVLFLEDLLFDVDGRPRGLSQIRYRGDRISLSARAWRRGLEGPGDIEAKAG